MSFPSCPNCQSDYVYQDQSNLLCPECAYEWNPAEELENAEAAAIKDVNGVKLEQGDKVVFIKDLKIKGSSKVLKIGAKGIIRRIVEGKDHQLDCKIDGIGEMMVTAKYVKKAQ
ncbi:zinc ribbon domain-containing protein YjdM [Vibrio tapetis subsp. quintayensis]|uniref:zinc ribbon domain-containing protein YjdM n=1 Tax=Vibrio tapetis TaxID=52443 RepID=UPI0025B538C5|nr:zinc ribbon domain-containing protein YjdM [Vibrio tapetis]MDN3682270.1 zinc ribbon domain-containing protein YjdM [Vibrio tapetis subsp. quintayensis]